MPGIYDENDTSYAAKGYSFINGQWVDDRQIDARGGQRAKATRDRENPGGPINPGAASNGDPRWGQQGLPGEKEGYFQDRYSDGFDLHRSVDTSQAINNTTINPDASYEDQARSMQQQLIDQLHGIASGKTVTGAEKLLANQYQKAKQAQRTNATLMRNQGAASAGQMAGRTVADLGAGQVGDANMLRTQQQAQANQMLSQMYAQMNNQNASLADIQAMNANASDMLNSTNSMDDYQTRVRNIIMAHQFGMDQGFANAGFNLNNTDLRNANNAAGLNAAATGLGAIASMYNNRDRNSASNGAHGPSFDTDPQYYKAGGSMSIVEEGDK